MCICQIPTNIIPINYYSFCKSLKIDIPCSGFCTDGVGLINLNCELINLIEVVR